MPKLKYVKNVRKHMRKTKNKKVIVNKDKIGSKLIAFNLTIPPDYGAIVVANNKKDAIEIANVDEESLRIRRIPKEFVTERLGMTWARGSIQETFGYNPINPERFIFLRQQKSSRKKRKKLL